MTDKDKGAGTMVREALDLMPEEMTIGEVAATVLMIVDGYLGNDKAASISLLLSAFITYASTQGLDDSKISMMLRLTAASMDAGNHHPVMH
jgi:hypothetical protein